MKRDVSVQEVMNREFLGASESDELRETAELMLVEDVDSIVVLRGSDPVGVVTERDALETFVRADGDSATVADAMTEDVLTVAPDITIAEAAGEMSAQSTQRVLVSNGSEPLGVLTEHDVMTASPFSRTASGPTAVGEERAVAGVSAGRGESTTERRGEGRFANQSLCEACGSLARDLSLFNGQLLCSDCRDI